MLDADLNGPRLRVAWAASLAIGMAAAASGCELVLDTVGIAGNARDGGSADAAGDVSMGSRLDGGTSDGVSDASSELRDGAASDGGAGDDGAGNDSAADGSSDAGLDGASDSGDADAGGRGPCTNDLSNIGTGDLTISFRISTTLTGTVAVVNQRRICNTSVFWDTQLQTGGVVQFETDDGTNHSVVRGSTVVNDGNTHEVLIKRVAQRVSIYVDSRLDPMGQGTSAVSFTALVLLAQRTDVCSGAQTFVGTLDSVCASHP
jgi:hypothetical protein